MLNVTHEMAQKEPVEEIVILRRYVTTREAFDAANDAYLDLLNGPKRKSDHGLFLKAKEAEDAWFKARDAYLEFSANNTKEEE